MSKAKNVWLLVSSVACAALAFTSVSCRKQQVRAQETPHVAPSVAAPSAYRAAAPAASDLTRQQALRKASEILAAFGLPLPPPAVRFDAALTHDPFRRRVWEIHLGRDYHLLLDSTSGKLVNFSNQKRRQEQVRGVGRDRPPAVTTEAQARQLLWRYARNLGLPPNAYLISLKFYRDNDPRISDTNRAGFVSAHFTTPAPGGYPYHHVPPGLAISIDPLDGVVSSAGQEWRYTLARPIVKLTRDQAISEATEQYRKHVTTHPNSFVSKPVRPLTNAQLRYVLPYRQRVIGGKPMQVADQITFPKEMRLAWIVTFGTRNTRAGTVKVLLDAADGSSLGLVF